MISRDDWLEAVAAADVVPVVASDALTIAEFMDLIGMGRSAAKARMDALVRDRKAEKVRKQIKRGDGAVVTVTAYRLLKES